MNVLIVEDESSMAYEIALYLRKEGYTCDIAGCGRQASEQLFVNEYDFLLLDLGLPDYNGFDLLKEAVARETATALLILTANGELINKVKGLDLGADDYLTKPFSLLELHSRMRAITRRKHGLKESAISFHGFLLEPLSRKVCFGDGELDLTRREFDILYHLLLHRNRVITRLQLAEHVWGNQMADVYGSNYIDVHIKNLRKKLSAYAPAAWLETLRGIGYRITL